MSIGTLLALCGLYALVGLLVYVGLYGEVYWFWVRGRLIRYEIVHRNKDREFVTALERSERPKDWKEWSSERSNVDRMNLAGIACVWVFLAAWILLRWVAGKLALGVWIGGTSFVSLLDWTIRKVVDKMGPTPPTPKPLPPPLVEDPHQPYRGLAVPKKPVEEWDNY